MQTFTNPPKDSKNIPKCPQIGGDDINVISSTSVPSVILHYDQRQSLRQLTLTLPPAIALREQGSCTCSAARSAAGAAVMRLLQQLQHCCDSTCTAADAAAPRARKGSATLQEHSTRCPKCPKLSFTTAQRTRPSSPQCAPAVEVMGQK